MVGDGQTADGTASGLGAPDRLLYALFGAHVDERRHAADRRWYRATTLATSFDVYLARVYGLSWVAFAVGAGWTAVLLAAFAVEVPTPLGTPPDGAVVVGGGLLVGLGAKRAAVALGGRYLRWRARARRTAIERTLPGAVRYLAALAAGSDDERAILEKVATQESAYGETAVAFRAVLNKAALTGSLDTATRLVARDTPSQETLAPFLLKFREYAAQGGDAVEEYLRLEGRMLSRRQHRQRRQAEGFLELLAELFIVLLVLPTLLVVVLTVLSVLSPRLSTPVSTPLGTYTPRVLLVYGSVGFVLCVGAIASWLITEIRPPNAAGTAHERSGTPLDVLANAASNPADAAVVAAPVALVAAVACWAVGLDAANVALLGYVAYGVPVGFVAVRRARLDDARDREIKDFVHAVSGHVSLGRPLPRAAELVARDVDLGALDDHVAALAFDLGVTSRDGDVRGAALDRFVEDVGTPLAEQTVGLVTGALDVGTDPETVFDTLQAEVGRLYHERKALRATLLVYVAVGWTTAVLVVGVTVAVNLYVLDSFEQLATVSRSMGGFVLNPAAVDPARDRHRFYLVAQATMLACGWFAGYAQRGRYQALLHSAALVAVAFVAFTVTGAV
ncbi:MAG: type II secretion system F family protein [Halobacteriaceae archaeon]